MQLTNGDKNPFYKFFSFIIEKFDLPVKMPQEKDILPSVAKSREPNIFIFTFL